MTWEVEAKYPVADLKRMRAELSNLGARFEPSIDHFDEYFNHPARDFAQTDEALRLRVISNSDNRITYKGPKIDATSKTRREMELPLPSGPGVLRAFAGLLGVLGFRSVGTVRKRREAGFLKWDQHNVEIALDEVEMLGPFLELEISAEDNTLNSAKAALHSLAESLKLGASERRSYLELLLDKMS